MAFLRSLTLHGRTGRLIYGSRDVAILREWKIAKTADDKGAWTLTAAVEQADAFQCASGARRSLLAFAAPRVGGFWFCPILSLQLQPRALVARCGPPEH